jgi:hypothetical protein
MVEAPGGNHHRARHHKERGVSKDRRIDFGSAGGVPRGSRQCWLDSRFNPCATGAGRRKIDVNDRTDLVFKERTQLPMSGVTSSIILIKLTLCGPTDVAKEMALAAEAINDWNCQHGEQRGFG